MANVHVDYQQLQTSATQLQSAQQDVEGQLTRLKSMIDNLVASGFVTDLASGRFQQSYEQWNTGARNVMAGLEGMSTFLKQAVQQHEQLDSQLSQSTGG
ncbi:MAG TPA: WXG100 family type VII secretion target [Actinomycetes bacterium]|nr:WXG100 family type VII secretion target [Actinomycetes bacterium]